MELLSSQNLLVSENPTHTIDFDRYSPSSLATVNKKTQIFQSVAQEKMPVFVWRIRQTVTHAT